MNITRNPKAVSRIQRNPFYGFSVNYSHISDFIKSWKRAGFMWLVAVFCVLLHGCGQPETVLPPEIIDEPDDLIIEIGEGVKMRFVPIEELNLLVGKYEVTNAEYRRFRPDHSSGKFKEHSLDGNEQPVVNVSWEDAVAFCEWLNGKFEIFEGRKLRFRLPTVEEWETYASCGDSREYPWGGYWPPPEDWNYYGAENPAPGIKLEANHRHQVSAPVWASGVNEWRLFGVGGNVWEWCKDSGDVEGKTRVLKGASWVDCHPLFLNIERSRMYASDYRAMNMGFRVVAEARDASAEEIEEFTARRAEEEARKQAEREKREAALARAEVESREREEQARRENLARMRGAIRLAFREMDFKLVSERLAEYKEDFGKDDFYREFEQRLEQTRLVKLSEDVVLEFLKNPGLDCWVGKYEITNREYRKFKPGHTSGTFRNYSLDDDNQPVVNVSWNDAKAFCEWLNSEFSDSLEDGQTFRLPTEREWEIFAASGENRVFPWGDEWPPLYGNFGTIEGYDDGFPVSCPVEDSGMNEWGLYGVAGNVWEWCEGWFDSERTLRIIKGGAWNLSRPDALRLTNRVGDGPDQKNSYIGFRVVIGPELDNDSRDKE